MKMVWYAGRWRTPEGVERKRRGQRTWNRSIAGQLSQELYEIRRLAKRRGNA